MGVHALMLAAAAADPWPSGTSAWPRSFLATVVVLALVGLLAWLARRGTFGSIGRRERRVAVTETVALLGDRRSLVLVTIEGRRLLLGLTPVHVSLVAELGVPSFDRTLAQSVTSTGGSTT